VHGQTQLPFWQEAAALFGQTGQLSLHVCAKQTAALKEKIMRIQVLGIDSRARIQLGKNATGSSRRIRSSAFRSR
jgi:hypothetical protein